MPHPPQKKGVNILDARNMCYYANGCEYLIIIITYWQFIQCDSIIFIWKNQTDASSCLPVFFLFTFNAFKRRQRQYICFLHMAFQARNYTQLICFLFFFLLFWNENCYFWHHWQFCIMPHILSCGGSCCRLAALLLLKCHHSKLTVWVREFTAHVVVIHIDTLCKIWNYAVSIGKQASTPLYLNALHLKTKQHKTKMQHKLKHLRRLSQVYTLKTSAQRLKCMNATTC